MAKKSTVPFAKGIGVTLADKGGWRVSQKLRSFQVFNIFSVFKLMYLPHRWQMQCIFLLLIETNRACPLFLAWQCSIVGCVVINLKNVLLPYFLCFFPFGVGVFLLGVIRNHLPVTKLFVMPFNITKFCAFFQTDVKLAIYVIFRAEVRRQKFPQSLLMKRSSVQVFSQMKTYKLNSRPAWS